MKKYTRDEVYASTLEYFNDDELAANSFFKYALVDKEGNYYEKNPDDMHRRLAKEFARIESKFEGEALSEDVIYNLLKNFKYVVPQGSPMMGIGNDLQLSSLSNCVVVKSPDDDISSIMDSAKELANLYKRRCGVGIDISNLRPDGTPVSNAANTSTGAWSFADLYSYVTRMIGQAGRRGALMITLDVRHPDVEKFITMKHDLTKVTGANISLRFGDDFMNAVKEDKDFELRWPCEGVPKITRTVKAKDIWELIVESATKTAEPGLMMWDNITKTLPAHCYPQYKTTSTNPCFSEGTMIAVADGRNAVSIKELAEKGKDVPVYSVDSKSGIVSVQWGRNPRITGYNKKLLKVVLDDGSFFSVTPDHKVPLLDGSVVEASKLTKGDSLHRFNKRAEKISTKNPSQYYRVYCNTLNARKGKIFEHRLISKFYEPEKWDKKYNEEKENGWMKGGLVVHHKDYDSMNNEPENLEIMTFKDHASYHAQQDTQGEKNGKFSGFSNEEIEKVALNLTRRLNRRFSRREWSAEAGLVGCPKRFSEWRRKGWFQSVTELAKWAATELGIENINEDPRTVRIYSKAISEGYDSKIAFGSVFVTKICEHCTKNFDVEYGLRESAYCSVACNVKILNLDGDIKNKRDLGTTLFCKEKQSKGTQEQARIFSKLKFEGGKAPKMSEWEKVCSEAGVPYRLGTKYGFKNYKEVTTAGNDYNHKVVSVEEAPGHHTVYNITVDKNHTVGVITLEQSGTGGKKSFIGAYLAQCGEVPLSNYDSCRLVSQNLKHYIINPFTPEATFDFELLKSHTRASMRLSDDLVELELEKLEKIIKTANAPDEKELFCKLLDACRKGRRTGLGTHALADAIARMGLKYGSKESVDLVDKIYEVRKNAAYEESVALAKERSPFPVWEQDLEKDNVFIQNLDAKIIEDMKLNGRRNISILTNAPTGSVSIMSQTSSGIEPVFRNYYTRRKKINHGDVKPKVDFVDDLGDEWQEFFVYHHNFKEWKDLVENNDTVPDFFVESDQIDWKGRIALQAAAQRSIDHSISSTLNLPKGTPSEVVGELYMEGWKQGLKGLTVYVDGSRSGVLVSNDEAKGKSTFQTQHAPKRPDSLDCEIHHVNIKGEKWVIFVGMLDDKPYEVFGGLSDNVEIPTEHKEGKIIKSATFKTKASRYDLDVDGFVIKNITKQFDNPTYQVHTRMVSLSLRHGAKPSFLVEQLLKDPDNNLSSFSKVLSRVLKKYIVDGEKVTSEKLCQECGEEGLVYQEGCATCMNCGYAKCG